jgi:hypothetical protein
VDESSSRQSRKFEHTDVDVDAAGEQVSLRS